MRLHLDFNEANSVNNYSVPFYSRVIHPTFVTDPMMRCVWLIQFAQPSQ